VDLEELITKHLWLVVWLLIAIYSFFKKKREKTGESSSDAFDELRRMFGEARGERFDHGARLLERLQGLVLRLEELATFAESDRRLATLHAAVSGELLPRARALRAQLHAGQDVVGGEYAVSKLERAASWLEVVARQRGDEAADLRAAERVAQIAAAPFAEFCRAQDVPYRPRPALAVRHGGRVERAIRNDDLPFSIVTVSADARRDPRTIPLIAREIGEAIFFDVPGLASAMAKGLSLPEALHLPATASDMRPAYLRAAFGPFLADLFADLYATSLFGPAYAEALLHVASHPRVRRDAYRVQSHERWVSAHPPLALRFAFVTEVLERLGRVSEAKRLRHRWEVLNEGADGYVFPAADGSAVKLPKETVHQIVANIAPSIIDFHHPTVEGFRLLDIPGLGYLHAEHAAVTRSMRELAHGRVPHEPPLLVLAATVLLAAEKPALASTLVELAWRAIRGDHHAIRIATERPRSQPLGAMIRDRRTLAQAVALGAALGRRPGPRRPMP
jgi:hypothetical protein